MNAPSSLAWMLSEMFGHAAVTRPTPFSSRSFCTVVSSLVICSITDQVRQVPGVAVIALVRPFLQLMHSRRMCEAHAPFRRLGQALA